jgi:hypothetical protein
MNTSPVASMGPNAHRDALLEQRCHFQQDIKRFHNRESLDPDANKQFQKTIIAYNNVMISIHQLDQSLCIDPIDKLPRELLGNILKDYVFDDSSRWYPHPVCKALLLTLVSKRWRNFVLSEPILWTLVLVFCDDKDVVSLFWLSMNLSGQLPVHVHIECCFDKWKEVGPCLFEHRERIAKVTWGYDISRHSHVGNRSRKDILGILAHMPPMPNLLEIRTSEWYDGEKIIDVFRSFPSLSRVHHVRFSRENLSERTGLRQIETTCTLYEVLKARDNLPNLETLIFRHDLVKGTEWSIEAETYLDTYQFLLKWKSLQYPRPDFPFSLLHRLPFLTTLQLMLNITNFVKTVAILHHLQYLKGLEIELWLFCNDYITEIASLSQSPSTSHNMSVDSLKLEIFMNGVQTSDIYDNYLIIYDILTNTLPNVKHMEIRSSTPHFMLFSLEKLRFSFLEDIYLVCWVGDIPPIQVRVPDQVRSLRVRSPGDIFPCLSNTSSIRSLTWTKRYSDAVSKLDLALWPSLEVLEAPCIWIHWNLERFHHIRSIILNECEKSLPKVVEVNANMLIKLLATELGSCPLLERIHFTQFPEWDLLFILLQRRNILNGPHMTPISYLSFPFEPPSFILNPLRQLLKGIYPDMPPLRELSLAGNVEIMLDREM